MTTFTVPASLAEAKKELRTLGKLLTAAEWERAAIVAAYVQPPGQGRRTSPEVEKLSAEQFAAFGIVGLKSPMTVRRYHARWMEVVGHAPTPGKNVTLPTVPFREEDAAPTGGRPRAPISEIADRAAKDPAYAKNLADALHAAAPEAMEKASPLGQQFGTQAELDANARRHEREFKEANPFLQEARVGSLIDQARLKLRAALEETVGIPFSVDDEEAILVAIVRCEHVLTLLKARFSGETGIDWDAEMANLNGGE